MCLLLYQPIYRMSHLHRFELIASCVQHSHDNAPDQGEMVYLLQAREDLPLPLQIVKYFTVLIISCGSPPGLSSCNSSRYRILLLSSAARTGLARKRHKATIVLSPNAMIFSTTLAVGTALHGLSLRATFLSSDRTLRRVVGCRYLVATK